MASDLSHSKCILLAVHFASEGNVKALHSFTPSRSDVFTPDLTLRIVLAYLPEHIAPQEYTTYVSEVASRLYLDVDREDVGIDASSVQGISEKQARRLVNGLSLHNTTLKTNAVDAPQDLLTQFLYHRAYRIDAETGLLNLVVQLVQPFIASNDFIRAWYYRAILPLFRLQNEYYPESSKPVLSLVEFERLNGKESVRMLMSNATDVTQPEQSKTARDIRGLIGPWVYGRSSRKRRKLNTFEPEEAHSARIDDDAVLDGSNDGSGTGDGDDCWRYLYEWMTVRSRDVFSIVTEAIEDWDGPRDIDLGSIDGTETVAVIDDQRQTVLQTQYVQAVFAVCYAVQEDTLETIQGSHATLARLATLLEFVPPPDLATSVESLPRVERHAEVLSQTQTMPPLDPEALLQPGHPLTTPKLETYMLLQMLVYSAYQFYGLGYPVSLVSALKLYFYASEEEQLSALRKILRSRSKNYSRRDEASWEADRAKLIWLWSWGISPNGVNDATSVGILGQIPSERIEEEMLKAFIDTSCFSLAIALYLQKGPTALSRQRVEDIVMMKVMEAYDGASNGNRTRGGVKKANDILLAFAPHFTDKEAFRQANALISATHALSFYSLTLQYGVPFQPVSIRVIKDPILLISHVLEQNPGSYTKVDDLIGIGRNLVAAGLPQNTGSSSDHEIIENDNVTLRQRIAERRVTFMAIEAALHEDDFETAYSYIISRLTPSSQDIIASKDSKSNPHRRNISKSSTHSNAAGPFDDFSWRAAFLAGRFRPATASPPSLRRQEQRTELLSLALLLAPTSALTEILAAWRRCEEEMTALQQSQNDSMKEFDDRADKRQSTGSIPGNFTVPGDQPALLYNQTRREMGRMTGKVGADEAPVSMFDLTRSAAQAFSKNAFPLRAGGVLGSDLKRNSLQSDTEDPSLYSEGLEGQQRTRKRDLVANAVSGGLASGLGWVLGATPVSHHEQT